LNGFDWPTWLAAWNQELLERLDLGKPSAFRHPLVTPELVAGGWLGAPGATEAEIAAAEARLGTTLPPSYRAFLAASNGFLQPDLIVPRLRAVSEVVWLGDEDPDTARTWAETAEPGDPLSELAGCLQVSDRELVGTAVYLLNPRRRGPDGEWAAYYLAHWVPGVEPYSSFRQLMEEERRRTLVPIDSASVTKPPPSGIRTLWEVLRGRSAVAADQATRSEVEAWTAVSRST
jgi:SMI1 / KNR4 family (SUKH-1)